MSTAKRSVKAACGVAKAGDNLGTIATETAVKHYRKLWLFGIRVLERHLTCSRDCRASGVDPDLAARRRSITNSRREL